MVREAGSPSRRTIRATGNVLRSSIHAHLLPGGAPEAGFAGTGFLLLPAEPTALPIAVGRDGVAAFARADGTEVLVESVHAPCVTGPQCAISGGGYYSTAARAVSPTGAAVPGYGPGGEAVLPLLEPTQALAEPSGAVLVLGRAVAGIGGVRRNALGRLTPQGLPDEGFGANILAALDCPGFDPLRSSGAAMARRTDGKLLVAQSYATGTTPMDSRVCVSRLLPDGSLDASFGSGGRSLLGSEFQSGRPAPVALFALPGGGSALFLQRRDDRDGQSYYTYLIATMTAEGALDASRFDRGVTGPTILHVAKLEAVAMQADGKFLVAGYPTPGYDQPGTGLPVPGFDASQPRMGRLLAAGGADLSFGPLGTGLTPLLSFGRRMAPRHVSIGPDRGILVAGSVTPAGPVNADEPTKFGVAKLTGDSAAAP